MFSAVFFVLVCTQLARPVFHVGFLDVAIKVLRSVCFHCSRLRLDKRDIKFKRALMIKNPKVKGLSRRVYFLVQTLVFLKTS